MFILLNSICLLLVRVKLSEEHEFAIDTQINTKFQLSGAAGDFLKTVVENIENIVSGQNPIHVSSPNIDVKEYKDHHHNPKPTYKPPHFHWHFRGSKVKNAEPKSVGRSRHGHEAGNTIFRLANTEEDAVSQHIDSDSKASEIIDGTIINGRRRKKFIPKKTSLHNYPFVNVNSHEYIDWDLDKDASLYASHEE